MKSGFTILETLLTTLIAAMISTILFGVLNQATRLQTFIDNRVMLWRSIETVQNQIDIDFSGAFIPAQANIEPEQNKKNANNTNQTNPENKKINQQKKLEDVLYIDKKDGTLKKFGVITSSILPTYSYTKPYIARVVYTLTPDKENQDIYTLSRQESTTLEIAPYIDKNTTIKGIEIAHNIAAIEMKYIIIEKITSTENENAATTKKETKGKNSPLQIEFKMFDQWPIKQEDEKKQEQILPHMIEFKISFWNNYERKTMHEINFTVDLIAVATESEKEESKIQNKQNEKNIPQKTPTGKTASKPNPFLKKRDNPFVSFQQTSTLNTNKIS